MSIIQRKFYFSVIYLLIHDLFSTHLNLLRQCRHVKSTSCYGIQFRRGSDVTHDFYDKYRVNTRTERSYRFEYFRSGNVYFETNPVIARGITLNDGQHNNPVEVNT